MFVSIMFTAIGKPELQNEKPVEEQPAPEEPKVETAPAPEKKEYERISFAQRLLQTLFTMILTQKAASSTLVKRPTT